MTSTRAHRVVVVAAALRSRHERLCEASESAAAGRPGQPASAPLLDGRAMSRTSARVQPVPLITAQITTEHGELSRMPFMVLPDRFLLSLLPDVCLLPHRWRPVLWCAGTPLVAGFLVEGMVAGPIPDHPERMNPFGVGRALIAPREGLSLLLAAIGMVASSILLVLRSRRWCSSMRPPARHRGDEHRQIKALAPAGVAALTNAIATARHDTLGPGAASGVDLEAQQDGLASAVAETVQPGHIYRWTPAKLGRLR